MGSPAVSSVERRAPADNGAVLTRRAFLALIAAGAATACSNSPERPDIPSHAFPKDALYYGASTPPENLAAFEAQLGSRLSCHRSFFVADEVGALHHQVVSDFEVGRMPIASIKPPGPWSDAADDGDWLESLIGPLGDLDRQLFLCVHHEPEDDTHAFGSAADYVAMQEAVIDAAARMARKVAVVPILSAWSFDSRSNRSPSDWNVHDAEVYGLDLYNPWSPTNGKEWVPFAAKFDLATGEASGRPMLIGEYGCRPDPAQPGRAAAWIHDAFGVALEGGVVAMSYYNSAQNSPDGTWELAGETFEAFADLLQGPHVAWLDA